MTKPWKAKEPKGPRYWKEHSPNSFCPHPECLFRISSPLGRRQCPTHPVGETPEENLAAARALHASLSADFPPQCGWCKHAPAGADGFCSRMCRVESWKANGDDSDFTSLEAVQS